MWGKKAYSHTCMNGWMYVYTYAHVQVNIYRHNTSTIHVYIYMYIHVHAQSRCSCTWSFGSLLSTVNMFTHMYVYGRKYTKRKKVHVHVCSRMIKNDKTRQMHTPKAVSDSFQKTELPRTGFEHVTACILGRCSTNYQGSSAGTCTCAYFLNHLQLLVHVTVSTCNC